MAIPRRYQTRRMVRGGKADPNGTSLPLAPMSGNESNAWEEPVTLLVDGDPTTPELLFTDAGDAVVMRVFYPD